jgi:calcineurin-like phosphoesterase family protein
MHNVWFTADTHFGHKKIAFYAKRRFCLSKEELITLDSIWDCKNFKKSLYTSWPSVSKMDDYLIKKINEFVKKDDILWHLGDFCFAKKDKVEETARRYRQRINCKNVFLILGNHDHPYIKKIFESYDYYNLKIDSLHIVLSHYAQAFWNKSHDKSWMLYGHAHGTAEDWLDANMPGRLSMDVGVDNIFRILGEYRPISINEISQIFSNRKGFQIDGNKLKIN